MDVEGETAEAAPMTVDTATASAQAEAGEAAGEWAGLLRGLLLGLESPAAQVHTAVVKAMCKLLPLATRGEKQHVATLLEHFAPFTDFDAYDDGQHAQPRHQFMLECLVAILGVSRPVSLAGTLKRACMDQGLVSRAATYLITHLPSEREPKEGKNWEAALSRPALPLVLQLLGALARGHTAVQEQLVSGGQLMVRLHALEGQSSSASKAIGTLAESLLEALKESAQAAAEVDRLRQATQDSKRKAALDKRQQILASMGMARSGNSKNVIVADTQTALMEDLEEETGHICVVCGEGETYRAGETLGAYCFCKRVPMPAPLAGGSAGTPGSAGSLLEGASAVLARHEQCYSTVTHFNVIHFACHREASRAERTMKQPKEEWEGATLRNSQTKCNNLFPFWGASVSEEAYAVYVEQWWSHLQHAGRVDGARCRLLAHDIKVMLLRFGLEESFSTYSKGGGRESNIKLLPYLVLMATFLLDARSSPQRRSYQRTLATWLGQENAAAHVAPDGVLYMMVLSLLLHSHQEWLSTRITFLQRALQYAGTGETRERASLMVPASPSMSPFRPPGRSPGQSSSRSPGLLPRASPGEPSGALLPPPAASSAGGASPHASSSPVAARAPAAPPTPFETCRPMMLFWMLVDRLQSILKGPQTWHASPTPPTGGEEAHVATMRERLRMHDQQVLKELAQLVRDFEEEMLVIGDFGEFADVAEILQEVLQMAPSADAFLANARGGA